MGRLNIIKNLKFPKLIYKFDAEIKQQNQECLHET